MGGGLIFPWTPRLSAPPPLDNVGNQFEILRDYLRATLRPVFFFSRSLQGGGLSSPAASLPRSRERDSNGTNLCFHRFKTRPQFQRRDLSGRVHTRHARGHTHIRMPTRGPGSGHPRRRDPGDLRAGPHHPDVAPEHHAPPVLPPYPLPPVHSHSVATLFSCGSIF